MSLTERQKISLYQILDVPRVNNVQRFIGEDNLVVQELRAMDTITSANIKIEQYLSEIALTETDRESVLKTYLDRWAYLGTDVTVVDAGSFGSISGVTIDPNAERNEIIRQVKSIVPFYRHHDEMSQQAKSSPVINVIR